MKPNLQRAALISIISSGLFIISNIVSLVSLYSSKAVLLSMELKLTAIAVLYCFCLAINIYVAVQLLKILKKRSKIKWE